ncbi:molybdenum cofactor guanylyltransferase MobA, partial [Oceanicola sp. S124]|uniref:molybdenum cofactor guanylyltransferase MobA n=1 Tax=Oceanicola sp. S124 TaxID=1042378 RepID=UPI0002557EA3
KALLPLAGRPLLAHVTARVSPQLSQLSLNANGDPARFAAFGLEVVADPLPDHPGPLAGVLAAMLWARELGAGRVFTLAADTPFLPGDFVPRLLLQAEGCAGPVLAASRDDQGALRAHPTCGLWPVALHADLQAWLERGERKMMLWAEGQGAELAEFPASRVDPFFNVNTPSDLARAEALLG